MDVPFRHEATLSSVQDVNKVKYIARGHPERETYYVQRFRIPFRSGPGAWLHHHHGVPHGRLIRPYDGAPPNSRGSREACDLMESSKLIVNRNGYLRLRRGHPWLFRDDIEDPPKKQAGHILPLFDHQGHYLGRGFYNPKSRIAFRMVTTEDRPLNEAFFAERIEDAIRRREVLAPDSDAYRLISSEADGLPGLVVDRYADCLSMQILSLGMDRRKDLVLSILNERLSPKAVVGRNDVPVRELEGLPREKGVISGELPDPLLVREGDLSFKVDLLEGQKTGAYLDQRENRLMLRSYAEGRRVLDAFSYDGWFTLHMAKAGASEVTALDASAGALSRLQANAERNGIEGIKTLKGNAFDVLKDLAEEEGQKESFDLVILDPPPFARRRGDVNRALKAYRDVNIRGLNLLRPGGLLLTCCCSHGVSQDAFADAAARAAGKVRRRLILLEQRLQPQDHPILFNEPESLYLKALLFRVER